jgi:hypothetical protein
VCFYFERSRLVSCASRFWKIDTWLELKMGIVFGSEIGPGRKSHHHDRRFKSFVEYDHEEEYGIKTFLHNWKNSDSELQYFSYRAAQGALVGTLAGFTVLASVIRKQPYIARKLVQ